MAVKVVTKQGVVVGEVFEGQSEEWPVGDPLEQRRIETDSYSSYGAPCIITTPILPKGAKLFIVPRNGKGADISQRVQVRPRRGHAIGVCQNCFFGVEVPEGECVTLNTFAVVQKSD